MSYYIEGTAMLPRRTRLAYAVQEKVEAERKNLRAKYKEHLRQSEEHKRDWMQHQERQWADIDAGRSERAKTALLKQQEVMQATFDRMLKERLEEITKKFTEEVAQIKASMGLPNWAFTDEEALLTMKTEQLDKLIQQAVTLRAKLLVE